MQKVLMLKKKEMESFKKPFKPYQEIKKIYKPPLGNCFQIVSSKKKTLRYNDHRAKMDNG